MMQDLRTDLVDTSAFSNGWVGALFSLQREQLDALLRWQLMLIDMQREAFDQWVCRWGGGVPIDA
jgi:hypothetical protein